MRNLALATMLLLAALVTATPVAAKELNNAQVCGEKDCATIPHSDQDTLMDLASAGSVSQDPPAPAPFYTVELRVSEGEGKIHSWTIDYYPAENLIRTIGMNGEPFWYPVGIPSEGLTAIMKKVAPFPTVAFDAAMEMGPGEFTQAHMKPFLGLEEAASSSTGPKIDAKPATAPAPAPSGTNWLVPALIVLGLAILGLGGLTIQRRRTATMAGASHPFV